MRSYLYQLSGELNWALEALEQGGQTAPAASAPTSESTPREDQPSFAQLKALIIQSADIVDAYCEQISKRLQGQYVAVSQFGQYMQDTQLTFNGTPTNLNALFENQQAITTQNGATILRSTDAWCKVGLLSEGEEFPVYGMEIGQVDAKEGDQVVYRRFARYCSDGIQLYDQNGIPVASISDHKLTVTNAHISGSLQLGSYQLTTDQGLAIRYV